MIVITPAAIRAAIDVLGQRGVFAIPTTGVLRGQELGSVVGDMLQAALPHLTDAGHPIDGCIDVEAVVSEQVGPTDYELWRDALQLAVQRIGFSGVDGSDRELLNAAGWFRRHLQLMRDDE